MSELGALGTRGPVLARELGLLRIAGLMLTGVSNAAYNPVVVAYFGTVNGRPLVHQIHRVIVSAPK